MAALATPATTHRKRTYSNPGAFFGDLTYILKNARTLKRARQQGLVPPAFRERLMLAVTAVNGCRYCSWFHAKEALKSGVEYEELTQLLAGTIDACPEDEAVALLYAHHWAESNAHPDPEVVHKLAQAYGRESSEAIHVVLRMIRMGNLLGNTWDSFLYVVTFRRMGSI